MALKQTLNNILSHAQMSGQPARVKLAKGLNVAVRVSGDVADIQLARADVFPSTQEWKTILNCWPGQYVLIKHPKPMKNGSMYYLSGSVRLVPLLVD